MPINQASTIKLPNFFARQKDKFFFLFANLMFFGVGNMMKVVKNHTFVPLFVHTNLVEFFGLKQDK